jgi:hypothetical protein
MFWIRHQTPNKSGADTFGQKSRATYRHNIWCLVFASGTSGDALTDQISANFIQVGSPVFTNWAYHTSIICNISEIIAEKLWRKSISTGST